MKVLVAPLDWGLGHATRCAPIVQEFLDRGCEVELAVVKSNARILREMFPNVRQRLAPSYNIVYPKHGYNMGFWLLKNSVHLKAVMHAEHRYAEEMVRRHHYDILVSDNRFAFYSKNAISIYMTHQRRIAFPQAFRMFETVGEMWHASVMAHFDEVWVPDLPDAPGYAGSLSHIAMSPRPLKFVGALSRFMLPEGDVENDASRNSDASRANELPRKGLDSDASRANELPRKGLDNDASRANELSQKKLEKLGVVAVISGVEPARTQFEARLRFVLAQTPGRHVMILGKPALGQKCWKEGNITFYSHLPSDEFAQVVRRAEWVVSRGGYSTVMDMAVLGAKCIFVPTPGQYEQVILARDLTAAGFACSVEEKLLTSETLATMMAQEVKCLPKPEGTALLRNAVDEVLRKV